MGTITFKNVSKTFVGRKEVRALDGISLTINEGEFVARLGPSGCGKSTLLNLLAGFEKTTEGTLLFDGATVTRPGPDRGAPGTRPRRCISGGRAVPMAQRMGKRCLRSARPGRRALRIRTESAEPVEAGGVGGVCGRAAGAVIGRHASARRYRTRTGDESAGPADGRAVRRP